MVPQSAEGLTWKRDDYGICAGIPALQDPYRRRRHDRTHRFTGLEAREGHLVRLSLLLPHLSGGELPEAMANCVGCGHLRDPAPGRGAVRSAVFLATRSGV